mgnify:CR=1 FL=1
MALVARRAAEAAAADRRRAAQPGVIGEVADGDRADGVVGVGDGEAAAYGVDAIYASPLRRAWETAEIIIQELEGAGPRARPVCLPHGLGKTSKVYTGTRPYSADLCDILLQDAPLSRRRRISVPPC